MALNSCKRKNERMSPPKKAIASYMIHESWWLIRVKIVPYRRGYLCIRGLVFDFGINSLCTCGVACIWAHYYRLNVNVNRRTGKHNNLQLIEIDITAAARYASHHSIDRPAGVGCKIVQHTPNRTMCRIAWCPVISHCHSYIPIACAVLDVMCQCASIE